MPFDKFPYTNFHELNLDYFIQHFKEIFAQWATLYDTMLSWKDATTAELSAWREEVETEIAAWETNLLSALDTWKTQTQTDISDWETATLSALDAWQTAFETLFDSTFSNLTDIKTDAEAARDAAIAAQEAAETAAATFETDTTLSVSGKAADAKVTGEHVMKWYAYPSAPDTFTIGDMPRFSYTFCDVARFANAPSGITSGYVCVVRRPFNSVGNISFVTVQSNNTPKVLYYGKFAEGETFGGWTRVAANSDIPVIDDTLTQSGEAADAKVTGDHVMKWYSAPASPATFGLADMPRYSYTFVAVTRFADAPSGVTGYASIMRKPYNNAGNMSMVTFQSGTDLYYGLYIEETTFSGWAKVATHSNIVSYVSSQIDSTLSVSGKAADAKATGDAINIGLTEIAHDYTADKETDWIIIAGSRPTWSKQSTATQSRAKVFRVPNGATKLKLTPNSSGSAIFTFLKSYSPVNSAMPDYATGWTRTNPTGTAEIEYELGADCVYMYTTVKLASGTDKTPSSVKFVCVRPGDEEYALDPVDTDTEDETGKRDRSMEIMLALSQHGVCHLHKGIYYVSGITMPDRSKIIGDGRNTIIRLLASVTSGTAVKMGASCEIRDVIISGAYSERTPSTTVGTRNGIEWTGSDIIQGVVSGCDIRNFAGAGIYLHDTTTDLHRNMAISDCLIRKNDVGIDIRKNSEFNRIVNCTIYKNGYGVRNRGGNNNISNCGIDGNIVGILVDDDEGSNWGHGTITGCSVNHSNSNTGYGLIVDGAGQMLVSNCNFYYSKIKLNDTRGNVISNCGFGSDVLIEVIDGGCSLITNCMFRRASTSDPFPISISGNTTAQFINCYDRSGYLYVQS